MARRRARVQSRPSEVGDVMPVSARVAWSYLAAVLAAVGAGLVVVLSNQTLAVFLCKGAGSADDALASCKLGWAIWAGLIGFALCLIPALLLLKLDWWLWAAMVAGLGSLIATDAITEWWWWAVAAFVPALASLVSANWQRGRSLRRIQLGAVLALDLAAAAALVWWYANG